MGGRINLIWGSFDLKLQVIVPFLRVKSDQRATSPPPLAHPFPKDVQPKFKDSKFVHCSRRVQHYVFEEDNPASQLKGQVL